MNGDPRTQCGQSLAYPVHTTGRCRVVVLEVRHATPKQIIEQRSIDPPRLAQRRQARLKTVGVLQHECLDSRVAPGSAMELGGLSVRRLREHRAQVSGALLGPEPGQFEPVRVRWRVQQVHAFGAAQHHQPHTNR